MVSGLFIRPPFTGWVERQMLLQIAMQNVKYEGSQKIPVPVLTMPDSPYNLLENYRKL